MNEELQNSAQKIKNIVINTIDENSKKYQKFLLYMNLNEENFSKSLKIELDEFVYNCKFNENIFTTLEKEGLLFLPNDKLNKYSQDFEMRNSNESNKIILLSNELDALKEKLRIVKEQMNQSREINKIKENYSIGFNQENLNDEIAFKNLEKIVNNRKLLDDSRNEITEDELSNIHNLKNEISEIYRNKQKLIEQKEKLENKMKSFCNLPADTNRIKEMIRKKRLEYEELNNN